MQQTPQEHFSFRLFSSKEGQILLMGIGLILCYNIILTAVYHHYRELFEDVLGMTGANLIFGRAAGLAFGFASHLDTVVVIALNMLIETALVLLIYPLLIMAWKSLLGRKLPWLERFSHSTRQLAEKHKATIQKYGPWGLFAFVFIPVWSTGPTVGCAIGYLLGFSHRYTLILVLGGTNIAILCWALLIRYMHTLFEQYGSDMLWIGAGIALTTAMIYIYRRWDRPSEGKK